MQETKLLLVSNQQTNAARVVGEWLPSDKIAPDNDRNVIILDDRGKVLIGAYYRDGDQGWWAGDDGLNITVVGWIDVAVTPDGRQLRRAFVDCDDQVAATEECEQREREYQQQRNSS